MKEDLHVRVSVYQPSKNFHGNHSFVALDDSTVQPGASIAEPAPTNPSPT